MAYRAAHSVKQTAMPGQTLCQNRTITCSGLATNPRWEKQNNLTHPKWLFTWPRRWMSTLFFQPESKAACVGTCEFCLLNEALLSAGISFINPLHFYKSLTLFSYWTVKWLNVVSSGWWPEEELTKQNSDVGWTAGLCDASVWGGWKRNEWMK